MRMTHVLAFMIVACAFNTHSFEQITQHSAPKGWLAQLPKPWTLDKARFGDVLPQFHEQYPDYHARLRALAEWRLGTPYKIFNLGEEQAPDSDPVFRMDVSDCTSHVLTTLALAESRTWDEARSALINIHYKSDDAGLKKPVYNKRWHYTSDRLLNHPMTPDVTPNFIDEAKLKTVSLHLNKKEDGSEFLALNWSLPVTVRYVPSHNINPELLATLPDMIGVAFVKESYFKMGVVMAHEGMLLDGKYLLHAGQVAQKTVMEDFMRYYFSNSSPRFDGIMLYEFNPLI